MGEEQLSTLLEDLALKYRTRPTLLFMAYTSMTAKEESGYVRDSPDHSSFSSKSDGDGMLICGGSHIWGHRCTLSNCFDGTISNNYMTHHEKVILLGHSDVYEKDKNMQVTVAFNHFGEGLGGRMPRCRFGYLHAVNNDYTHWKQYAIGGSACPTVFSQGNRFLAPDDGQHKEVTKHFDASEIEWKKWNWRSEGYLMLKGVFFRRSGAGASSIYAKASSLAPRPCILVSSMTAAAGALECKRS